jgi:hypothetical protein
MMIHLLIKGGAVNQVIDVGCGDDGGRLTRGRRQREAATGDQHRAFGRGRLTGMISLAEQRELGT